MAKNGGEREGHQDRRGWMWGREAAEVAKIGISTSSHAYLHNNPSHWTGLPPLACNKQRT